MPDVNPRHSSPQPPTSTGPRPANDGDLTVNKIIAGAGAAATSAVAGSFFGAAGTVTGAALGSVVSTVGTAAYQRSLDRTRDTVRARMGSAPQIAPDGQTGQARGYVTPAVEPRGGTRGRRLLLFAGATVLIFLLSLLAVTVVEFAKGTTLTTGRDGTSVGRVLDPGGGAAPPANPEPSETPEPSAEPSPTESGTPEPSGSTDPSEASESPAEDGASVEDTEGGVVERLPPTSAPPVPGIG